MKKFSEKNKENNSHWFDYYGNKVVLHLKNWLYETVTKKFHVVHKIDWKILASNA